MNICNKFRVFVKRNRQLRVSKFVHEFAHFKIVYIFQLENLLRYINGSNFASHKFICV